MNNNTAFRAGVVIARVRPRQGLYMPAVFDLHKRYCIKKYKKVNQSFLPQCHRAFSPFTRQMRMRQVVKITNRIKNEKSCPDVGNGLLAMTRALVRIAST